MMESKPQYILLNFCSMQIMQEKKSVQPVHSQQIMGLYPSRRLRPEEFIRLIPA